MRLADPELSAFTSGVAEVFRSTAFGEVFTSGSTVSDISDDLVMLFLTASPAGLSFLASEEEIMAGSVKVLAGGVCVAFGRRPGGVYLFDRPLADKDKGGKSCR